MMKKLKAKAKEKARAGAQNKDCSGASKGKGLGKQLEHLSWLIKYDSAKKYEIKIREIREFIRDFISHDSVKNILAQVLFNFTSMRIIIFAHDKRYLNDKEYMKEFPKKILSISSADKENRELRALLKSLSCRNEKKLLERRWDNLRAALDQYKTEDLLGKTVEVVDTSESSEGLRPLPALYAIYITSFKVLMSIKTIVSAFILRDEFGVSIPDKGVDELKFEIVNYKEACQLFFQICPFKMAENTTLFDYFLFKTTPSGILYAIILNKPRKFKKYFRKHLNKAGLVELNSQSNDISDGHYLIYSDNGSAPGNVCKKLAIAVTPSLFERPLEGFKYNKSIFPDGKAHVDATKCWSDFCSEVRPDLKHLGNGMTGNVSAST